MQFRELISRTNLELAWRRITTGKNQQYKRFFREIYYGYETGLDANLRDLHQRLKGGSYEAQQPTRVYTPKPSGLQRPLTLLSIEDQIVYQAAANLMAARLRTKRQPLELKSVFSSILEDDPKSIFFLKDWRLSYHAFQDRIAEHFHAGLRWIAHFDLAAFYDTISHDQLLRTVYPRLDGGGAWDAVTKWLKTWSSETSTGGTRARDSTRPYCFGLLGGVLLAAH